MAKTTNSEGSSNANNGTKDGGDYGKVHIVNDWQILNSSIPSSVKTPPPPPKKNDETK